MDPITIGVAAGCLLVGAVGTYFFTRPGDVPHSEASVKAEGAINNVLVTAVQDSVEIESKEIVILLGIMCSIKVVEFLYFIYSRHVGGIRKKYGERGARNVENPV